MKPVSITRRSDRQRGRRKKKPDMRLAENHYIEYTTPELVERSIMYGTPIQYIKVHLDMSLRIEEHIFDD